MRYHYTVKHTTAHYMSLTNVRIHAEAVWCAEIRADRDGPQSYVARKDFKSKGAAERWGKDMVKRYQAFYDERGFDYDRPYQLRQGNKTIGHYSGPTEVRKAALKLDPPDGGVHHLWITTKDKASRHDAAKRTPTERLLRWYDAKGDPISHENPVTWRIRRTG